MISAIRFSLGLIVFVLSFSFQDAQAAPGSLVRECASTRGSNQELTLYIYDGALTQLRIHSGAVRARAVLFQLLAAQTIPDFTVYTLPGSAAMMQIENTVLNGDRGTVEITGDSFSCL